MPVGLVTENLKICPSLPPGTLNIILDVVNDMISNGKTNLSFVNDNFL